MASMSEFGPTCRYKHVDGEDVAQIFYTEEDLEAADADGWQETPEMAKAAQLADVKKAAEKSKPKKK